LLYFSFAIFKVSRPVDNTNWRVSRLGGPCFQMKNVNFRQAAQKSSLPARSFLCSQAYCAAHRPALMCSPLTRPVVHSAGPPFCAAGSPQKMQIFHLATRPSSPAFSLSRPAAFRTEMRPETFETKTRKNHFCHF